MRSIDRLRARYRRSRAHELDDLRFRIGQAALMSQRGAHSSFKRLWDAEVKIFSQWGEDGILEFLCDVTDLARPRILELGAGNFSECNSRFLAENRCASVMAVDASEDLVGNLTQLPVYWRTTVLPRVEWITPDSAPALMQDAQRLLGGVDILSLDIDGNDYWVMESLDLTGVKIIVAEYNPLFGSVLPVSVPRNDTFDRTKAHSSWLYYGASLTAYVELLTRRGFIFLGSNRPGNNAFFIHTQYVGGYPLALPDPSALGDFVDWRVRESRGADGELTYVYGEERMPLIQDEPLVNTITGQRLSVGDTGGIA